eukprot:m.3173 g.3173  ORF g.3173 m.3173 type:complete len:61 (-) comp4674_c0_seq1:35-217(-)
MTWSFAANPGQGLCSYRRKHLRAIVVRKLSQALDCNYSELQAYYKASVFWSLRLSITNVY